MSPAARTQSSRVWQMELTRNCWTQPPDFGGVWQTEHTWSTCTHLYGPGGAKLANGACQEWCQHPGGIDGNLTGIMTVARSAKLTIPGMLLGPSATGGVYQKLCQWLAATVRAYQGQCQRPGETDGTNPE